MKLNNLIKKNLPEISDFFLKNINDIKKSNKKDKLEMICPFCHDRKTRYKLTINLDWGNFKCFRCGESGTLFKLLKQFGLVSEFFTLINSLTTLSAFDIKYIFKNNSVEHIHDDDEDTENSIKVKNFIKSKGLIKISKIPDAYNYAKERVFNNENELDNYLVDDKYIYIPIIQNEQIISYLGRRYIELKNIPRYNFNVIEPDITMIGFLDDVVENMSSNKLYITEGYFDAYAINHTFANYVSICTFGTSKYNTTISSLANYLPRNTNVYLALDSPKKDNKISEVNIKFGKELIKYFSNVYVCTLEDGDPADILKEKGSIELRTQLEKNIIPFAKYHLLNIFRNNNNQ